MSTCIRVTFTNTMIYDTTVEALADLAGLDPLIVQMLAESDAADEDGYEVEVGELLEETGRNVAPNLYLASLDPDSAVTMIDDFDRWTVDPMPENDGERREQS
jgi:hypothetical protein